MNRCVFIDQFVGMKEKGPKKVGAFHPSISTGRGVHSHCAGEVVAPEFRAHLSRFRGIRASMTRLTSVRGLQLEFESELDNCILLQFCRSLHGLFFS